MSAQKTPEAREEARQKRIQKEALQKAAEYELKDADILWFTNLYVEYHNQLRAVMLDAMKNMPVSEERKNESLDNQADIDMAKKERKKLSDQEAEQFILGNFERQEKEVAVKREYYALFRKKLTPQQLTSIFILRPQRANNDAQGNGRRMPGMRPMILTGRPAF